jgi:hypothetical protein
MVSGQRRKDHAVGKNGLWLVNVADGTAGRPGLRTGALPGAYHRLYVKRIKWDPALPSSLLRLIHPTIITTDPKGNNRTKETTI